MHRKKITELLERYHPSNSFETESKMKMLSFLKSSKNCFENSGPRHFTASSWLENCDGSKFLLTEHKKMKRWLNLGGHADGDSDLLRVAFKETHEESGLKNIKALSEEIFYVGVYFVPEYQETPDHYHYDVTFLMKTSDKDEQILMSDESTDLRWFDKVPCDDLGVENMFRKWKNLRDQNPA